MNIYAVIEGELKLRAIKYGETTVKSLPKPSREKARKLLFPMLGYYGVSTDRKMRIHVLQCIFSSIAIESSDDLTLNQIYLLRDARGTIMEDGIKHEIERIQAKKRL